MKLETIKKPDVTKKMPNLDQVKVIPDKTRTFSCSDKKIGHDDLSKDQAEVLSLVTSRALKMENKDVISLGGYAGSGKSTLIPLLAENLDFAGSFTSNMSSIAFCCFTGKAANVLKRKLQAAGISEQDVGYIGTIHGLIYTPDLDPMGCITKWSRKRKLLNRNESPIHKIIIDEASMVGLDMGILVRSNTSRNKINRNAAKGNVPKVGDIVICLKNKPPLFNGMRGIIEDSEAIDSHWYQLTVYFKDDGFRVKGLVNKYQFNREKTLFNTGELVKKYKYPKNTRDLGLLFDFGMALTVHKSQGSSFEEAILFPEYWPSIDSKNPEGYRRWLYTGVTRAAKKLYLYGI